MDDLIVFHAVESDTQGLNALGVQLTGGESKVSKLDMSLAIHKEVLGHEAEYTGFNLLWKNAPQV